MNESRMGLFSLRHLCVLCDSAVNSFSFEDSVQKPAAGLEDSEEPPSAAGLVFYVEVVSGLVVAVPPGAGDAFGADGVDDGAGVVVEGEGDGGAVAVVGGADHDGDLARGGEEVEG